MFFRKKRAVTDGQLDLSAVPAHIGIIMDGNGRWAKAKGLPRTAGHRQGAKNLETIAEYCSSVGVKVITAYAFSTENWSRPQDEVNALMDLLYDYLMSAEERFARNNARFIVSGDVSRFSDKLREAIAYAEKVTESGKSITINLALNYGGRDELVRAAREICHRAKDGFLKPSDIDESYFSGLLDTAGLPEVDLIIRPSGELRLSNFLLWQAAYAEFWFSDICWPDFSPECMERAIIDYQRRNRRFGGV